MSIDAEGTPDVNDAIEDALRMALEEELAALWKHRPGSPPPVFARRAAPGTEPPYVVVLCLDLEEPASNIHEAVLKVGYSRLKNAQSDAEASATENLVWRALKKIRPGYTDHVRIFGVGIDGGGKTVEKNGLVGKIWTGNVAAALREIDTAGMA